MGFTKGDSSDVADSILQTFTDGLKFMGLLMHMPWLLNTLGVLTSLAGPMKVWKDWSVSQMDARIAVRTTISIYSTYPLTPHSAKTSLQTWYPTL